MNCQYLTIVDSSSLYLNGVLVANASVNINIEVCNNYNYNFNLNYSVNCLNCNRFAKVNLITSNESVSPLNATLSVKILPLGCGYNNFGQYQIFSINDLQLGCSDVSSIYLPYNHSHYYIVGQLIINNNVVQERSIII